MNTHRNSHKQRGATSVEYLVMLVVFVLVVAVVLIGVAGTLTNSFRSNGETYNASEF